MGCRWQRRWQRRRGGSWVAGGRGCGGGAPATAATAVVVARRDPRVWTMKELSMTPSSSRSSDNAGMAVDDDAVVVVDVVVVSAATSPLAPWAISPSPPPLPPPPLDLVREDRVRGNDVDNDCDGPSIVAVVMSGWLRKRTRRGTWVRRWFVLDSSGGVHYSRHPPPPPGSSSGSKPSSQQQRANRVVALVGGGGACHPLRTIPLVERGGKKKTK